MNLFPRTPAYSEAQKYLHWAVLLLCLAQFPTSWAIQRTHVAHALGLAQNPLDLLLHRVHAFTGWIILLIVGLRLVLRFSHGVPALPARLPDWQRRAAEANHLLLYAVLVALPVTGTMAMYVTQMAAPVHRLLVYLGIGLVLVHVAAAVLHAFRGDGVIARMIPSGEGESAEP